MRKIAFFAFRGDEMCFMHLVLNAMDLHKKGYPVKIIMEGEAVTIIEKLEKGENKPYLKAKGMGLFDCICKACSAKLGVLEFNETVGIPLKGNLEGHPAMEDYIKEGYEIITL
jgi:hypothetical protein